MVSTDRYKKLLKDHAKFKVIKKSPQQIVTENNDRGILVNTKIKRIKSKIESLEIKISECANKKDKVTFEMAMRKEKAKLKTLVG